ncbi:MAG: hemolysin family protein [Termitinemataceae bacterium]|nr:MAG: hemolysin family protein [Termitinemataceae bacterium]
MKSDPIYIQLLVQFVLIFINAVFACAEIALISLNSQRLQKEAEGGSKKAKRLLALKSNPDNFLGTIQVGITLAGFLGSAFAADSFSQKLSGAIAVFNLPISASAIRTISLVIITIILSFFTMVLGELLPKRIAMKEPQKFAYSLSFFLFAISKMFAPIVSLLTNATRGLLFLFHFDTKDAADTVSEEEILLMVDAGSESGTIEQNEKQIINNVFEFDDKTAKDVMTHRLEAIILSTKNSDDEWEKIIIENHYSHYPVCGETFDEVLGVLKTRDFLLLKDKSRQSVMTGAVDPALFVPTTIKTDVLLKKMKQHRSYFALVIDEYGGLAGLVSITDLMEFLVGDLGFEV